MTKQLELFTGAEVAPESKTPNKTKKEAKPMKKKPTTKPDKKPTKPATKKPTKPTTKPADSKSAAAVKSRAAKIGIDPQRVIVATVSAPAAKPEQKPAPKPEPVKPSAVAPVVKPSKPAVLPPKSWEAFKIEADAKLTAAAPSACFRPKSTKGLIKVHALGLWIKPSEIVAYHAARRDVAIIRADYLKRYFQTAFEAEIRAAGGDEAAALSALGINYHDDRGDGKLHVVRMLPKHVEAWITAAAAAGVKVSRVVAA